MLEGFKVYFGIEVYIPKTVAVLKALEVWNSLNSMLVQPTGSGKVGFVLKFNTDVEATRSFWDCVVLNRSNVPPKVKYNLRESKRAESIAQTNTRRPGLYSIFFYVFTHRSSQDDLLSGNEANK